MLCMLGLIADQIAQTRMDRFRQRAVVVESESVGSVRNSL